MKTKTQKIEEIRKKCIEANPEIVELKLGCKTSKGMITSIFESNGRYGYAMTPYTTHWDGANGEAIAKRYSADNFEIIGRPIRLADVLLAIEIRKPTMKITDSDNIDYGKMVDITEEEKIKAMFDWDLKSDDLEKQSEETISFLHNLLT